MGGLCSNMKTDVIEEELERDKWENEKKFRFLLLGPGEAGKSTFFKQMTISYRNGHSRQELVEYTDEIRNSLLRSVLEISTHYDEVIKEFNLPALSTSSEEFAHRVREDSNLFFRGLEYFTSEYSSLLAFWKDPSVQTLWRDYRNQFQIADSMSYFMDERLDDLKSERYTPTEQDILQVRLRTTGVIEREFVIGDYLCTLIDVGGQRSERRKWINCFDNVQAVLFLASLSEYDKVIYDDRKTNSIDEAVSLFEEMIMNPVFKDTLFFLFLNKVDLFKEKVETRPLSKYITSYEGNDTYEDAAEYVKSMFEEVVPKDRDVITFFTCAMDNNNSTKVMNQVKLESVKRYLKTADLLF